MVEKEDVRGAFLRLFVVLSSVFLIVPPLASIKRPVHNTMPQIRRPLIDPLFFDDRIAPITHPHQITN